MRNISAILLLAVIPGIAVAVPVDPNAENGIAAQFVQAHVLGAERHILCTNGDQCVARYGDNQAGGYTTGTWSCWPSDFPVPISEVADWTPNYVIGNGIAVSETIILRNGQVWVRTANWMPLDTAPGSPPLPCNGTVKSEDSAFGKLKSMFR